MPRMAGKKKMTTKPRRKQWRRKGARVALPKRTTGNFASSTEQYSGAATAGIVYDFTTTMANLTRTKALMAAYQYYRITSVEMRFKPQSDSFIAGGAAQIPYLNFQYDKSGALQGSLTAAGFEAMGTKAIRLDDKTVVRKWKPSVVTGDADINVGITQFKVSPWLPTYLAAGGATQINDQVQHLGACFYISKQNPSDATAYDIDVVVNVQFRKPLVVPATGDTVATQSLPIIKQGYTTAVDVSLNPLVGQ